MMADAPCSKLAMFTFLSFPNASLDQKIVSVRSCVRAAEAKLCECVSEEAASVARANSSDKPSLSFFYSALMGAVL